MIFENVPHWRMSRSDFVTALRNTLLDLSYITRDSLEIIRRSRLTPQDPRPPFGLPEEQEGEYYTRREAGRATFVREWEGSVAVQGGVKLEECVADDL